MSEILYIDPGTGSLLVSNVVGLVLTILLTLKVCFYDVFEYTFQDSLILNYRTETMTHSNHNNIPDKAIIDGVVQIGINKGESLYNLMYEDK